MDRCRMGKGYPCIFLEPPRVGFPKSIYLHKSFQVFGRFAPNQQANKCAQTGYSVNFLILLCSTFMLWTL